MTYQLSSRSLGAQVLSAGIDGQEPLYLSPLSSLAGPARGGVPVLFPQFAQNSSLIKHGFARNLPWVCVYDQRLLNYHQQKYTLAISPQNSFDWRFNVHLELSSKVDSKGFYQELKIINLGVQKFEWTGASTHIFP